MNRLGNRAGSVARVSILGLLLSSAGSAQDPVVRDGSLGSGPLVVPVVDDEYVILPTYGEQRGKNLFHSFSDFSIPTDEIVTFTGPDDPAEPMQSVERIFSRVTGNSPSYLDGTLRSTIPRAALFLFNSNGIAFGRNAKLDLQGSFHASTANEVHLLDKVTGEVTLWPTGLATNGDLLTDAMPSAFGFTTDTPASITMDGSALGTLPAGETFSLIGGDVQLVGGASAGGRTLTIDGGTVQLASVRGSAEVPIEVPIEDVAAFDTGSIPASDLGIVALTDGIFFDVSGNPGGRVVIRGGQLVIDQSQLISSTRGDLDGAALAVDVQVAGLVDISGRSKIRSTSANAEGRGGDLQFVAGDMRVRGTGTLLGASSEQFFGGTGEGGDVRIHVDGTLSLEDGAQVVTSSGSSEGFSTPFGGDGGDITIDAGSIVADDATILAQTFGDGSAGDIRISADGSIVLEGSAQVVALSGDPDFDAGGDGGHIFIDAGSVVVEGMATAIATATYGSGLGGDVSIDAGSIVIDEGNVEARTLGSGQDSGTAGNILLIGDQITVSGSSATVAAPGGDGNGGSILIYAGLLRIDEGAQVSVSSLSGGDAGDIVIHADELSLDGTNAVSGNPSGILSQSASTASGAAGSITLRVTDTLSITNGAQISVSSQSITSGPTGNIDIEADRLVMRDSLDGIRAESVFLSPNDAGDIFVRAGDEIKIEDSSITSKADVASGGNIDLSAGKLIQLRRRSVDPATPLITAEVAPNQSTQGGSVFLAAQVVVVDRSGIRASSPQGLGGDIQITADGFAVSGGNVRQTAPGFFSSGGVVFAVSGVRQAAPGFVSSGGVVLGPGRFASTGAYFDVSGEQNAGSFEVRAPDTAVVASLSSLSQDYLDVTRLAANECAARTAPVGSLIVAGQDRVPAAPDERIRSLYVLEL